MIYVSAQDEVSVCSGISALFHLSHCKQSREILILITCKPISVIRWFYLLNHSVNKRLHSGLFTVLESVLQEVIEELVDLIDFLNMLQIVDFNQISSEIFLESHQWINLFYHTCPFSASTLRPFSITAFISLVFLLILCLCFKWTGFQLTWKRGSSWVAHTHRSSSARATWLIFLPYY